MNRHAIAALSITLVTIAHAAEKAEFKPMFAADLSDAINTKNAWTVDKDGVFTASEDASLWTKAQYENFTIDLEFRNAEGTNSGVIIYCTDIDNWIPNSVEVQIADDFSEKWSKAVKSWQCAAIFGRHAASKSVVKKPGEWNRMVITCHGPHLTVTLNGALVNDINMKDWKSAKKNPDGTDIPAWLNRPMAELATKGQVGLQGKHAGAPIWFRNVKIRRDQAE